MREGHRGEKERWRYRNVKEKKIEGWRAELEKVPLHGRTEHTNTREQNLNYCIDELLKPKETPNPVKPGRI